MNENTTKPARWKRLLPGLLIGALILGALLLAPGVVDAMVLQVQPSVTIEAGEHFPWPDDFLIEDEKGEADLFFATDVSGINTRIPGTYPVELRDGENVYTSEVIVADTIAPTGAVQDLTVKAPEIPTAEDFFTEKKDVTKLTVSFKTEPDFTLEGDQQVSLLLTDAGGNVTEFTAKLTMIFDLEPPVITGVDDHLVYAGDAIAYRSGVTVTDNRDTDPQLTIDSSAVDLSTPGEYTVTYTATDYVGNTASVSATVTVREKQPDYVDIATIYAAADQILSKILKEDMTVEEQARAIGSYVRYNYGYSGSSIKDDWLQGAYRMIRDGAGDCFNYFSLTKLLLERLDIPNIDVEKVPNHSKDSHHYWSLVSVDGGENYYHLDTTPRTDPTLFILVTDKYMDNYSAKHRNCFNRDTSLYPATPEEPLA